MKRSILIFTLSLFFSLSTLIAQEWQVMPEQPQAGEKMTIHYNPTGGELEGTDVYAIAYVLQYEKMPDAHDVEMSVSDNGLTGHFQVPADAQAIMVKFTNEDGSKKDNNNDEAYHTMVFKNGKPVKNAYAASSSAYGSYARTVGIKSNT